MAEKDTQVIDARLSKMSLEELQAKLDEAERQANVYRAAIDERRQAEIDRRLEELKALGWQPPTARATRTASAGEKKQRQRDPNKPCRVCGETGHDARRHRKENIEKKQQAAS